MSTERSEPLTDTMIRRLRAEAYAAGDFVTAHACGVALDEEDIVADADAWEERYGGGGHSREERAGVLAIGSREAARSLCAEVINDARGMDSKPFVRVVA